MNGRVGLGVEIGGTKAQVAVVRDDGRVLDLVAARVATSFHVAGWDGFPLAAWLAERIDGRPVVIENDANAAAFAEATVGAGRGARSIASPRCLATWNLSCTNPVFCGVMNVPSHFVGFPPLAKKG